jgi:hypothetical protein
MRRLAHGQIIPTMSVMWQETWSTMRDARVNSVNVNFSRVPVSGAPGKPVSGTCPLGDLRRLCLDQQVLFQSKESSKATGSLWDLDSLSAQVDRILELKATRRGFKSRLQSSSESLGSLDLGFLWNVRRLLCTWRRDENNEQVLLTTQRTQANV